MPWCGAALDPDQVGRSFMPAGAADDGAPSEVAMESSILTSD